MSRTCCLPSCTRPVLRDTDTCSPEHGRAILQGDRLPADARPAPSPTALRVSEDALQGLIVDYLARMGYTVWEVQKYGHVPGSSRPGTTAGTPDLFVGHPQWGPHAIPMEIKTRGGAPSVAQMRQLEAGVCVLVWSLEDVQRVLQEEWRLQGETP